MPRLAAPLLFVLLALSWAAYAQDGIAPSGGPPAPPTWLDGVTLPGALVIVAWLWKDRHPSLALEIKVDAPTLAAAKEIGAEFGGSIRAHANAIRKHSAVLEEDPEPGGAKKKRPD